MHCLYTVNLHNSFLQDQESVPENFSFLFLSSYSRHCTYVVLLLEGRTETRADSDFVHNPLVLVLIIWNIVVTYPHIWTIYRTYGTITGMLYLSRNLDPRANQLYIAQAGKRLYACI